MKLSLPAEPVVAAKATCMPEGPVGVLRNGVSIFNSLDGRGDDAVAQESRDLCDGHPANPSVDAGSVVTLTSLRAREARLRAVHPNVARRQRANA